MRDIFLKYMRDRTYKKSAHIYIHIFVAQQVKYIIFKLTDILKRKIQHKKTKKLYCSSFICDQIQKQHENFLCQAKIHPF